ncbi:MAG: dihydroorotate dehydrogenase-like protein [Chromatiaceae bacterium]|nr:dihydroorotate dehydrogenase-like protein [Chromatiaceae bacterium]MCP5315044.1 dihydroorotate dehydrogenase-like protein [Chromatiaceae bacterium]
MNLSTEWLGLQLGSPLVPSASPLSRSLDAAKQLEDAGAGAIVMYSLFEEAVQNEEEGMTRFLHEQDTGHAEASSYLPSHHDFPSELDRYLEQVASLKASLEIPVVASLNGVTASGWMTHAKEIAEAGADALELNAYYVAGDVWEEGHYVEQRYITLLNELREQVGIPINMKLSPFFSSIGNLVKKLEGAGVRGVSLFNRFYQPDIDVEGMRLTHTLTPTNSTDALLAMRWVAMLHGRVGCSLAATGGVHTGDDAIKLLLAGSDVVHLCQTLLLQGPQQLQRIGNRIAGWMEQQGFEQLSDFRGRLSQSSVLDPSEYERLNYIRVLGSYTAPDGVWR